MNISKPRTDDRKRDFQSSLAGQKYLSLLDWYATTVNLPVEGSLIVWW